MKHPKEMDKECIALCDALNEFKKTEVSVACCGHLKAPFRIWFRCSSFTELAIISRAVDRRYAGTSQLWRVVSDNSDTHPRFGFMLESEDRYVSTLEMQEDTNKIADNIRYWRDNFIEYFRSDGEVTTKSSKHVSSLPSNLDEAAEEYADYNSRRWHEDGDVYYDHSKIMDDFKAGAEWMAEQGFSFQDEVIFCGSTPFLKDADFDILEAPESFKPSDKVIVQIRKKEE